MVPAETPIIAMKGVHKHFRSQPVLRGVDLTVARGEKVLLIGPSGCGKSTLLRCINALEQVDEGEVTVNGTKLHRHATDLNRFRAKIGLVFQQFNLFPHLTVLENITLAPVKILKVPKAQAREHALRLLARVGMPDKAGAYPDELSGGQKQRVAIARSLAMEPELMLLDEPTSALDPLMTREVLSVIEDLARQGMTLVMVSHEIKLAERIADRVLYMENGLIMEESPSLAEMRGSSRARAFLENI
jgi:ABC-type polar amino acid transport system ATPase subunit